MVWVAKENSRCATLLSASLSCQRGAFATRAWRKHVLRGQKHIASAALHVDFEDEIGQVLRLGPAEVRMGGT